jgi:predicted DNA-binding transcriptional regulator
VSGGGIDAEGRWVEARKNDWQFLFPVKAMAEVYRGKFLQAVKQRLTSGAICPSADTDMGAMLNDLYRKNWVVYAKAPFAGPHTVIEYLGRYTHKVAISNHRLEQVHEDDSVSFTYKDYREAGKQKKMRLSRKEFIRRFSQHILPRRFTKIRSYGYLANRNRSTRINQILRTLKLPEHHGRVSTPNTVLLLTQYGKNIHECPKCKGKTMELIQVYLPWKDADDG